MKAHAAFEEKSDAPIGGTLIQMRVLAEKLAEDPDTYVAFLLGNFGQPKQERCGSIDLFGSTTMQPTILNTFLAPFRMWRDFRKIDPDIVIASSAGIETGIVFAFCRLGRRRRFIYRVAHEWDCSGEYAKRYFFRGIFFEWGLRGADVRVAQSEEQRTLLKKKGLSSIVIRNSFVMPSNANAPRQFSQRASLLWVSRCEPWKHPELFLQLAQAFPEESFVMICPPQKYGEEFFEMIRKQSSLIPNLRFLDFVPFSSIQTYFDEAKVFVGTSEYEGFPNTYIQACLGATPIISYRVNPDHIFESHGIGFCANGSWEAFVDHVRLLLHDKGVWDTRSSRAYQYVHEYHDIEKNIQKWITIFTNSLDEVF